MNYIDYIKHLKNNNIQLFDSQYRITFHRLLINNQLTGAGITSTNNNILNKLSKNRLNRLVESLLNNNEKCIKYILQYSKV